MIDWRLYLPLEVVSVRRNENKPSVQEPIAQTREISAVIALGDLVERFEANLKMVHVLHEQHVGLVDHCNLNRREEVEIAVGIALLVS